MKLGRHGIVAALLGCVLSFGLHSIPDERPCPQGSCDFSAPTAVRGVESSPHWLQISWKKVPKAFSYRVQVARENNFLGDEVMTVVKQDPERPKPLVIPKLDPGTTYHVRVSVIDRTLHQQSEWSAPATYATKGPMRLAVGTYNVHNPADYVGRARPPCRRRHRQREAARARRAGGLPTVASPQPARPSQRQVQVGQRTGRVRHGAWAVQRCGLRQPHPLRHSPSSAAEVRRPALRYQVGDGEVDRWFAWATFTHRASGWSFLFVTTHLAPDNDDADLRQWKELIGRVNALKAAHRVQWVVVAGDFNTTKWRSRPT